MAINILDAFNNEPKPLDFVIPGLLPGTVGALIAPGATGKSYLALETVMAVACDIPGGDLLDLQPKHTGHSVYLALEDPEPVIRRRLYAIGGHLPCDVRETMAERVHVEPMLGKQANLITPKDYDALARLAEGARLVVIDTLSRAHALDENSNGDMAKVMSTLERLAAETGAAVVFTHHTSKAASFGEQTDHQHASRGASLLTDNARWAASIVKMSSSEAEKYGVQETMRDMFVRFTVTKNNYGPPTPDMWYRRAEGGVLRRAVLDRKAAKKGGNSDLGLPKTAGNDDW